MNAIILNLLYIISENISSDTNIILHFLNDH